MTKNQYHRNIQVFVMLLFSCFETPKKEIKTTYQTDGDWITGYNLNRYNNRPLYINNTNGLVLTGDRPLIRFVKGDRLFGNLVILFKRNGETIR